MFSKRNQLLAILLAILMTLTVGCFTSGDDNNITNPPTQPETGLTTLTGTITDAVTGDPIAGATITLTGSDTVTTTTNDSGEYTFSSLTTGEYQISISIDGYITTTSDVTVNETEIPVNITDNLVISEELSEDVFRFVLSWGESPSDLDAHLWTGDYHIYYGNKGDSASEPYMFLDIDDTQSYGPETITIKQITGPCKFAVHNFSGGSETAILSSSAHIDVYQGSSKIAEYDIPSSGTGYWWYVCDMEGSGDLAAVNEIQVDAPEGFTSPPYDKP